FFVTASSFLIVSWIEGRIESGHVVSAWWQILAYVVLSAAEVLVSITALEFAYTQAPLKMKSFVMAMFLLSVSLGNAMTAVVNHMMVKPLSAASAQSGGETWLKLGDVHGLVTGQKVDVGGKNGLTVVKPDGKSEPMSGTFLVEKIDESAGSVKLM